MAKQFTSIVFEDTRPAVPANSAMREFKVSEIEIAVPAEYVLSTSSSRRTKAVRKLFWNKIQQLFLFSLFPEIQCSIPASENKGIISNPGEITTSNSLSNYFTVFGVNFFIKEPGNYAVRSSFKALAIFSEKFFLERLTQERC